MKASGCSTCGTWPAPSTTCSGHPSRVLAASARPSGTKRSCRPHSSVVGTATRSRPGTGLRAERDQPAHRPLDVRDAAPAPSCPRRTRRTTPDPRRRTRSRSKNARRSNRSALRSDGRSANRIAVTRSPSGMRYRPTPGARVDDEPLEELAVLGREAGGEAAAERVCDQRRGLVAGHTRAARRTRPRTSRRRAGRPARTRPARAGRGRRRGGARRAQRRRAPRSARRTRSRRAGGPAAGRRRPPAPRSHVPAEDEPPLGAGAGQLRAEASRAGRAHDRRLPITTAIVSPRASVGLNSTISAPAWCTGTWPGGT